jgi:hypothetical protein
MSYWQPTPYEVALIVSGQPIRLHAWGRTHPPVHIGVCGDGTMVNEP